MVAGVKFASNSWTVGGRADLYTGAVQRRQLLHNPGKFISARPPASLPRGGLDRERSSTTPPLGRTGVTAARRVVSTCGRSAGGRDHPRAPARRDYQRNYAPRRRFFSSGRRRFDDGQCGLQFSPLRNGRSDCLAQPTSSVTSPFRLRFVVVVVCIKGRRRKGDGEEMNE